MKFVRKVGTDDRFKASPKHPTRVSRIDTDGQMRRLGDIVAKWDERNALLFEESVLERLAPPPPSIDCNAATELSHYLVDLEGVLWLIDTDREELYLWKDQVTHILRDDVTTPAIFVSTDAQKDRETLKGLLALRAFRFLLPKLGELEPEELLEVRCAVASTREGFSMHLQTLSAAVESRIQDGDSLEAVASYANSIVETQLIPDYVEFKRQLAAKRAGFWKKVLERTGKVFEIDAAPWTPKFYGELFKAVGFTILTGVEGQKENFSNRGQAHQFMRTIEDKFV